MAKPRVFVSSTFYDLRTVRAEIEAMLRSLGFDPVLNERGSIPYERTKTLEQSCYREIASSDIVVSIIGGRLGAVSAIDPEYSISQMELRTAVELDKQLFIFVDKSVSVEYHTWLRNEGADIKLNYVDDARIYEFLRFVFDLPRNNAVQSFEVASEISQYLREQFAGLFQQLLSAGQQETTQVVGELRSLVESMSNIVSRQAPSGGRTQDPAVASLVFANQPLFVNLRKKLKNRYRIFFLNLKELNDWLRIAKSMSPVDVDKWDEPNVMEWYKYAGDDKEIIHLLKISRKFFDDEDNVQFTPSLETSPDDIQYYLGDPHGVPIGAGTTAGDAS